MCKKNKSSRFIITGDFNAHNTLWGSKTSNKTGKIVENWIEENELVIMNDDTPTRIDDITGKLTNIDLTLSSQLLAHKLLWYVWDDTLGSDHFPIIITFDVKLGADGLGNKPTEKFNFKKADWNLFKNLCTEIAIDDVYSDDVDRFCENLTKVFLAAGRDSIPVAKSNNRKHNIVPWWNEDCKEAVTNRKQALNKLKRNNTPENLIDYKEKETVAKNTILEAKRDDWKGFCDTCVHKNVNSKDFWTKIKRIKGSTFTPMPLLKMGDKIATTGKEKANFLVKHYKHVSSDANLPAETIELQKEYEPKFHRNISQDPDSSKPINFKLTLEEMKNSISTRKDTAMGHDQLSYLMFKHMPDSALGLWLELYNKSFMEYKYPTSWKQANVIPIKKPNKNSNDPKSYRPISLTSHAGKIYEHIVASRIRYHAESNNLISKYQSGFRKGRSTIDQLTRLQHDILYAKNIGNSVLAVFLDLQAAFDLTWHTGILIKLKQYGVTGRCFHFVSNFLKDRKIQVKVDNELSETEKLDRGTPQGSIISPLLFTLMVNDLPEQVDGTGLSVSQFADDSATWLMGHDYVKMRSKAQEGLNKIMFWAKYWGFKISKEKTVAILFGNSRCKGLDLKLGDTQIVFEEVVKFLGMYLDKKLNFRHHINQLKLKCQKDLNLMKMLKGTDFGADKASLILMYKALIKSKLSYGSFLFADAPKSYLKDLDVIQNKALKIALGALGGTPSDVIEFEAGVPPLSLVREEQCLRYWARVQTQRFNNPVFELQNTGYVLRPKLKNVCKPYGIKVKELIDEYGLKPEEIIYIKPSVKPYWTLIAPTVSVSLSNQISKTDNSNLIKALALSHYNDNYTGYTQIYTDGSKNPQSGIVSSALVVPGKGYQYSTQITQGTSIYTAELFALKLALTWVISNNIPKTLILSDSLSSLISLQSGNFKSRPDLCNQIVELNTVAVQRKLEVVFEWCPAHVGISGNERADTIAKNALSEIFFTDVGLAPSEVYSRIRVKMKEKWHKYIVREGSKVKTKPNLHSINFKTPGIYSTVVDKEIGRLRMGYSLLPASLGKYYCDLDPSCTTCKVLFNQSHMLLDCVLYSESRKVFKRLFEQLGLIFNENNMLYPDNKHKAEVFNGLENFLADVICEFKI